MTTSRYSYGIAIEGIGSDTAKTAGVCWYWGQQLTSAQKAASDYEWIGGAGSGQGLIDIPSALKFAVDPFTCDVRTAGETFSLHYPETYAQRLLVHQQTDTGAYLDIAISATASTITLAGAGSEDLAQSVIWLSDECIKLGSHFGGGLYTCTRTYWSTRATVHTAGEKVYTRQPYALNRIVRLVQYDRAASTEAVVWTGAVEDFSTSNDGTKLDLSCRDFFSLLKQAVVNRGAGDLTPFANVQVTKIREARGTISHDPPHRVSVAKADDVAHAIHYQIDEALFGGRYTTTSSGGSPTENGAMYELDRTTGQIASTGSPALWGSETDYDADEMPIAAEGPIHEVLVIDRLADEDEQGPRWSALANWRSATRELAHPFHPIAIAMALLCSTRSKAPDAATYDVLGWRWGLGIPLDLFDIDAIDALIAQTSGIKIDRMLLGWDGEPVEVWETIKNKLLRPYGFFLGTTHAGLVSFSRYVESDVGDLLAAESITAHPFTLKWDPARSQTIDILRAKRGGTPWMEGESIDVYLRDYSSGEPQDSLRAGLFSQKRESEIDYSTKVSRDDLITALANTAARGHMAQPRLKIQAAPGNYGIGDRVLLATPEIEELWFIDAAGEPTGTTEAGVQFLGQIIERRHNIREGSYDITLLLTNRSGRYPRWRAPSAVISGGADNRVDLYQNVFHANEPDASKFAIGDWVEIWTPNGQRVGSEPRQITIIAADSIAVDSAFVTGMTDGNILRISRLSTGAFDNAYPEAGNPAIGSVLAYCFAAATALDGAHELGASATAAHAYGSHI